MNYLFSAYTIIFVLIAAYVLVLGNRQKIIMKEIQHLQELQERISTKGDSQE